MIAVVACVLATALGFLAAYAFVRGALRGKKLLLSLLLLPIIVPTDHHLDRDVFPVRPARAGRQRALDRLCHAVDRACRSCC